MIADDDNIVQHMLLKNFTANYTIFEINEWTHLLGIFSQLLEYV